MELLFESWLPWVHRLFGTDPDWKQVLLSAMMPIFILAFGIEFVVMRRRLGRMPFACKDVLANLSLGLAYQVFELIAYALLVGAAVSWVHVHRIGDIAVNAWTLLPIFIGVEFSYYWFHRVSHRVRWFWSAHVVHHSGEHMNMTTAMRQSLLYSITGWWLFFVPLIWLGVHPGWVFFLYAADLSYQYFVHTESVRKLPAWFEYIFVTPSHHRVHHGRNRQYIDKNFGGVLILFDRWFGTFAAEVEPVDYGIRRQIKSHNFLRLNLHEFVDMWRDVFRPGPLRLRLKHLWAPPEWTRSADS